MSKFYEIKDVLSLSNYSKKYDITLRKIYRYLGDEIIEHFIIDGVAFLPDKDMPILKENHKRNELVNHVKILTRKEVSVTILTEYETWVVQSSGYKKVNSDKILTPRPKDDVQILTLKKSELKLISTHDDKLGNIDLVIKYDLIKKYLE